MGISVQFRRGLDTDWTSGNPILLAGELGYETNTGKFKIGDGVTHWNDLDYGGGQGDMLKSTYDINNNGIVDAAEGLFYFLTLADGEFSGAVDVGVAGDTISLGQIIMLNSSSKWIPAKADVATHGNGRLAVCLLGAVNNAATEILTYGKIQKASVFTLTVGAPIFLSAATAGAAVDTPPVATGNIMRTLGAMNSSHELFFDPSPDYFEHT